MSVVLIAVAERRVPPRLWFEPRTYFAAGRHANHWAKLPPTGLSHNPLSCHTPLSDVPLLSYATPHWVTPHPAELHPIPLSHAIPHWGTPHPSELCCWATPPPHWVTPQPAELHRTLLSYATTHWATPHPTHAVLVNVRLGKGFTLYTIPDPSSTGGLTSLLSEFEGWRGFQSSKLRAMDLTLN